MRVIQALLVILALPDFLKVPYEFLIGFWAAICFSIEAILKAWIRGERVN